MGLSIKLSESNYKIKSFLNIHFSGAPLSSITQTMNLDGISSWSDIQIYVDCNKKSFHQTLPDIGGHKWKIFKFPGKQAKILLTLLKLRIPLESCKKDEIKRIKLIFTEKPSRHKQKKEVVAWKLN